MIDYILLVTEKGGWILLPIFLMAVLGWWIVFYRYAGIRKVELPHRLRNVHRLSGPVLNEWARRLTPRDANTVIGAAALAVYGARRMGKMEMMNRLDGVMKFIEPELEKGLSTLANLATTAPLMGLLGTVSGMVGTFKVIKIFGTSNPAMMADSISEALMTTQNGLLVAIPLMIIHIMLVNKIERLQSEARYVAQKLMALYLKKEAPL
jgi:biopolymer transport protein ExbB